MSVAKFSIDRSGATLSIRISDSRTGHTFAFQNTSAGQAEWAASLLLDRLRTDFFDRIRAIRVEAYEAGWHDAKARTAKKTWFSDCINVKCFGGEP